MDNMTCDSEEHNDYDNVCEDEHRMGVDLNTCSGTPPGAHLLLLVEDASRRPEHPQVAAQLHDVVVWRTAVEPVPARLHLHHLAWGLVGVEGY